MEAKPSPEAVVLLPVLFKQTFDCRFGLGRCACIIDDALLRELYSEVGRHGVRVSSTGQ